MRPQIPSSAPENYASLMTNCWDVDPTVRPTFLEIMTRLESLDEKSTGWGTSSSSGTPGSHPSSDAGLGSHESSESHGKKGAVGGVKPPIGEVTIVFTDVVKAGALWDFNAEAMKDATLLHNDTVRSLLGDYGGYEVVSMSSGQRKGQGASGGNAGGGEGSFCVAFQDTSKALEWCMTVQEHLMQVDWPKGLLQHPAAAEEWGDTDDRLIFRGLRVRMGVHVGEPRKLFNAMSRRAEYVGPTVNTAARITTMAHGGQILVSEAAHAKIKGTPLAKEKKRLTPLGKFEMPDSVEGTNSTARIALPSYARLCLA
jgi:class 3 adenylate cyclase